VHQANISDLVRNVIIIIIIIIIISTTTTIRHELGLDTPDSAWYNSLFKSLPSGICPFGI
jgi:hypothetical protein